MLDEQQPVSFEKPPVVERPHRGPHTVLNPEGRINQPATAPPPTATAVGALPVSTAANPRSSLVRLLFPPESDSGPPPLDPAVAPRLGHYLLADRIRSGGMGAVFRAIDPRLQREVALKILPPHLSRDPGIVERFRREAQLSAQLDHLHIARVFDVGEDLGLQFIAFEYIPGLNVRDLIVTHGRFDVVAVMNYALQIARALVHMSIRGIVHRDIKPSNVIITPEGIAKLVDMGLARSQTRDEAHVELTAAGTTLGTFDYIAPEQARDPRMADSRSDIYSLGCTIYHMLTAEPPYPEGTVLQKLLQHQGDSAPDPAAKNPRVPPVLSAVVRKMMAKDPKQRHQTPAHLVRDLQSAMMSMRLRSDGPEGVVWTAPPPGPSFWRRNFAAISTICLLAAILLWIELAKPQTVRDRLPSSNSGIETGQDGQSERRNPRTNQASDDSLDEPRKNRENDGASIDAQGANAGTNSDRVGASSSSESRDTSDDRDDNEDETNTIAGRTNRENDAGGNTDESEDEEESSLPVLEDEGFVLLGRDGTNERRFVTLEAAVAAVKGDGAVIELRFNGKRREKSLKVNRRMTIRADRRYLPTIEFAPTPAPDSESTRAITVTSGSLDIVGGTLVLHVGESSRSDGWSLFALDHPDALRLQGTIITINNPQARAAAAIEWILPDGTMMPEMPLVGPSLRTPLDVELKECLVRGDGDLFLIRRSEPIRLEARHCILALRGALLHQRVAEDAASEAPPLELRLDHATCVLGDAVARVDSSASVRKPPRIQIGASNCIFSAAGETPLITMAGSVPLVELRSPFSWMGQNNFYDRIGTFWNVVSRDGTGRTEAWDFATWRKHWTESGESNSRNETVVWSDRAWRNTPYAELQPTHFSLDHKVSGNHAVGGSGDSTDAGVNLQLMPRIPLPTTSEAPRDRTRS